MEFDNSYQIKLAKLPRVAKSIFPRGGARGGLGSYIPRRNILPPSEGK